MGDLAGAFDAWSTALQLDPMRAAALKGVGFLYFRAGDVAAALDHLQRAAEADPDDASIPVAIARLRSEGTTPRRTHARERRAITAATGQNTGHAVRRH